MASKFQIQLQYRTALQQASRLEELAENLLRTARTGVGETMSELQICWTGENARAYLVRLNSPIEEPMAAAEEAAEALAEDDPP